MRSETLENGLPVRNEAGEAVICHPQKYRDGGFVADQVPIYCFVPRIVKNVISHSEPISSSLITVTVKL